MQVGEGLGRGQAEPGPLVFTIEVAVDLAERRQRLGNVIERHADARVGNLEHMAVLGSDGHLANSRRELDRVGQQVDDDLLELVLIGMAHGEVAAWKTLSRPTQCRDVESLITHPTNTP